MSKQCNAGFSLIEVLVALVVAGTMIGGFVGLSQHSVSMVENTRRSWDNINFAQEFLSKRPFVLEEDVSPSFTRWTDWSDRDAYWRLSREESEVWQDLPPDFGSIVDVTPDELGLLKTYTLETRVGSSTLSWQWLAL